MDSQLIKQLLQAAIRNFAAPLIAAIALKLGITEDVTTTFIVAAITAAVMYVWSIINKVRNEQAVETALMLPQGTSKSKLGEVLNSK